MGTMSAPSPDGTLSDKSRRRRRDLLRAGIIVGIGVLVFTLLMATRDKPPPLKPEEKAWPVSIEPLRFGEFAPSLQLYGEIESPTAADVASNLAAEVDQVKVLEGDVVQAGQLMVRLDDTDAVIRVRGDEASLTHERELLALARKDHTRAEQLFKEGLASAAQVDAAKQTVEQRALAVVMREQSLAGARVTLERSRIKAPINGRVTRVLVAVGDRAQPGQVLVSLYDPRRLELRASIPVTYLPRVQEALAARGTLPAHVAIGEKFLPAELIRISAEAKAGSSNVDGFFRVQEAAAELEPGRALEVTLTLPPESGVAVVPFEALHERDRVYLVKDQRMLGVKVAVLGEYRVAGERPRLLVRSPALSAGQPLIVTPLPRAMDGLKVTAQKAG